ncbi:MAG: hypothetical protein KC415_17825 [Anaerolineales bacterium]|nr:hypothetical protein [Anaerolineales bacterium]MCB8990393.1 hypothetical protein [Ardenticatenaceae bacterium]MCB9003407.1 hypothetical protein [Ardenticatenaceae bacterium]
MTQQQSILKGNEQLKLSSAGFIVGALLIIIGNIWVTLVGLGDPLEALNKYSENVHLLQTVALLITFGWWAVLIGVIGVSHSITARGAAWARLGLYFMIMGSALWTLGMALDISYSSLISNWLAAPDADKAFARELIIIYGPTVGIGRGLFPMNVMANWLAIGFLSVGMLRSAIYPRRWSWAGIVLGMIGLPIGATMAFIGREAIWTLFTVLAFLTILWFLALGIWLARESLSS